MTETQAKSGTTGTSMNPVERSETADGHAGVDRSAVGRASVPHETVTKASVEESDTEAIRGATSTATVEAVSGPPSTGRTPGLGAPTRPAGTMPSAATGRRPGIAGRPAGLATVEPSGPSGPAGRVAEAVRSARSTVSAAAGRGPRRARLFVKRVDPWSVMKFSFAVSFVMFFVLIVATAVLYLALDQMSVFASVNKALSTITSGNKNIKITAGVVIGASGAIGLVMVVLFTALSTLGAFIYNVCADLVGGIEVTLSEKE